MKETATRLATIVILLETTIEVQPMIATQIMIATTGAMAMEGMSSFGMIIGWKLFTPR